LSLAISPVEVARPLSQTVESPTVGLVRIGDCDGWMNGWMDGGGGGGGEEDDDDDDDDDDDGDDDDGASA